MNSFVKNIFNSINDDKIINKSFEDLKITGTNPWTLSIELNWKDIGRIRITPFDLSDFWALKDWWNESLSNNSKNFFPLLPDNKTLERAIANHFKNHQNHRDIAFNIWLLKEGEINIDFDNEIIAHFFLEYFDTHPDIALGIADKYQAKGLGKLILLLLIYLTKFMDKKKIYLSVDKDNLIGFELYKKIGFKKIGEREITIPITEYKNIVYDMEKDLEDTVF